MLKSYSFFVILLCALVGCQKTGQVNVDKQGVAVKGYDVIGYFTEQMPVKGKPEFAHIWQGATYYFKNAENRDLFKKNPQAYAPQYGGFCAFGVTQNKKIDIVPEAWDIVDNKLYLNYTLPTQEIWLQHRDENIQQADQIWPGLRAQ